jgi:hypothetical protein
MAVLIAGNVTAVFALSGTWTRRVIALGLSIIAIPVGWRLQDLGLEKPVQEYGLVFSGRQFLLGPDRQHTLNQPDLFARWAFVQASGVLAIPAGV